MAKKRAPQVKETPTTRRVETIQSDVAVPMFYANNATVDVSTWDVKLRMGVVERATADVVSVRDLVHVYMSHDHFRAYVASLNGLIINIDAMKAGTFQKDETTKAQ